MKDYLESALRKVDWISKSSLSIYDEIDTGDEKYWLTASEIQAILDYRLKGTSLKGLPLRTRSKTVKVAICKALGYPIPKSFKKTKPRFIGQKFDTYTQKSNNLQVWNEDLDLSRRYVLIRINEEDLITRVKVVSGSDLAPLDTTGTLTQKYQASLKDVVNEFELVSDSDTGHIIQLCGDKNTISFKDISPIDPPQKGEVLAIKTIYEKLKVVIGQSFTDPGSDQERNRGAELHKLVCKALGFDIYQDSGQFPDVKNQLLEVKLQTSPTIDLGLISPDSEVSLDMEQVSEVSIRHCDIRYAVFYGKIEKGTVHITNLILTNGQDFFGRFPKFEGKGLNKKIQIPLPKNYFDDP